MAVLHILLFILKLIGILLLVILGLVLLILAMILFVPVRYRLSGSIDEKLDTLNAQGQISYLANLIRIHVNYRKDLSYKVKIAFFTVLSSGDSDKESETDLQAEETFTRNESSDTSSESENVSEPEIALTEDPAQIISEEVDTTIEAPVLTESENISEEIVPIESENDAEVSVSVISENTTEKAASIESEIIDEETIVKKEKKPEKPKKEKKQKKAKESESSEASKSSVSDRTEKIAKKLESIYDKIQNIEEKKDMGLKYLQNDTTQYALGKLIRNLLYILKKECPKSLDGEVTFGFDNPAITGYLCAVGGVIHPIVNDHLVCHPDFEQQTIKALIAINGKIKVYPVVWAAIRLVLSKKVRISFKRLMLLKNKVL